MKLQAKELIIHTERLILRPTERDDAERALAIQSNWHVCKNLRMAAYPPTFEDLDRWFAKHGNERIAGTAYRFAIMVNAEMAGVIDIDEIDEDGGDLGYWLDQKYWGKGFAQEAGRAMVVFAFEKLALKRLRSGHAVDNPASGRVLQALGFKHIEDAVIRSRARECTIEQRRYALERESVKRSA